MTAGRLILTGRGPFRVDNFNVLQDETMPGYRLVVDLSASSESDFEAALALQAATTGSTSSTSR